jgi:DNA-binding NtrC family response regulator
VQPEPSVQAVMAAIKQEPIAVVICDRDWVADDWKSLLDEFAGLSRPPMLIVTSRLADDRLWAEALNLGAYDVISKPFDACEVVRIAGLACAHWNQCESGRAAVMHSVA